MEAFLEEEFLESDDELFLSDDEPLPSDVDDEEDEEESLDGLSELEEPESLSFEEDEPPDFDEPLRLSVL